MIDESEVFYIREKLDGQVLPPETFTQHADNGQTHRKHAVASRKSHPRMSPVSIEVPLGDLHGPTGHLDAAAVANYLSIPLAKLAVALGINYTTLHKTPDSLAVQPALITIKRVLVVLSEMLGKRETVLAWLNSPHPDLGNRTPISIILEGHGSAVVSVLENALAGIPS